MHIYPVKIPAQHQRIPVKIVLDTDADKDHLLRVGMSVEPTVLVK